MGSVLMGTHRVVVGSHLCAYTCVPWWVSCRPWACPRLDGVPRTCYTATLDLLLRLWVWPRPRSRLLREVWACIPAQRPRARRGGLGRARAACGACGQGDKSPTLLPCLWLLGPKDGQALAILPSRHPPPPPPRGHHILSSPNWLRQDEGQSSCPSEEHYQEGLPSTHPAVCQEFTLLPSQPLSTQSHRQCQSGTPAVPVLGPGSWVLSPGSGLWV